MAQIILTYDDPDVTIEDHRRWDVELERELLGAAERVLGRKPDRAVVTGFHFTMAQHAGPDPQSDESNAEREVPAVCQWCKGKREITINFKTKPCGCVKEEVGPGFQALREVCRKFAEAS